jgi:hypothetical protein
MGRGKKNRIGLLAKPLKIDVFGPLIVALRRDDKLEFIVWFGKIDILPAHGVALMAIWAFDIDDLDHGFRNGTNIDMPSGFEHDRITTIQEGSHQWIDLFLFQGFAACHLHKFCRIACENGKHFVEWHFTAAAVGVLRVAVDTSK